MRYTNVLLLFSWLPLIQLQMFHFDLFDFKAEEIVFFFFISVLLPLTAVWMIIKKMPQNKDLYKSKTQAISILFCSLIIWGIPALFTWFFCNASSGEKLKLVLTYSILFLMIAFLGIRAFKRYQNKEGISLATMSILWMVFVVLGLGIPVIFYYLYQQPDTDQLLTLYLSLLFILPLVLDFLMWLYPGIRSRVKPIHLILYIGLGALFLVFLFAIPFLYYLNEVSAIRLYLQGHSYSLLGAILSIFAALLSCGALIIIWREAQKQDKLYLHSLKFILVSISMLWQLNLGFHFYYHVFSAGEWSWHNSFFIQEWVADMEKGGIIKTIIFIAILITNILFLRKFFFNGHGQTREKKYLFVSFTGLFLVLITYLLVVGFINAERILSTYFNIVLINFAMPFITITGPILFLVLFLVCTRGVFSLRKSRARLDKMPFMLRAKGMGISVVAIILYVLLFKSFWPVKDPAIHFLMGVIKDRGGQHWKEGPKGNICQSCFYELFIYGESAVVPMIKRLEDDDGFVRWVSALFLINMKDKRAVEPLIEALEDDDRQSLAAWALVQMKDQRGADALITALKRKKLGYYAIPSLGELGDSRALAPLLEQLNDDDGDIRISVIEALSYFKDARVVEALLERLKKEQPDSLGWRIKRALCRITGAYFSGEEEKMYEWWQEWWNKNREDFIKRVKKRL